MLPLSVFSLIAQDYTFTAKSSHTQVATAQQFKIEFSLNANGSGFTPPDLSAFRVLSGPNQSTSMSWVNGQTSSSLTYSYYLLALKEGEFTIGPAKIKAGNEIVESNPIKIKVVKGDPVPQQYQQQQQNQQPQSDTKQSGAGDQVFLSLITDKNTVYVGQPIIATYKLYTRVNIVDNDIKKMPDLNGFWSQELKSLQDQTQWQQEIINGQRYNVVVLKQSLLFPQRSGNIELDAIEMDITIQQRSNKRPQNIFDQFFGGYENVKYPIKSSSKSIQVLPHPEKGKPESFNGATGKFSCDVSYSKTKVKANEAIDVKIKISGSGNLKLLPNPELNLPSDFEVYDPEIKDEISYKAGNLTGSRSFHYLVIPRQASTYEIQPYVFSYFDTELKQYKNITSEAVVIDVEKSLEATSTGVFPSANKKDIEMLGSDIRYIQTHITLKDKKSYYRSSLHFLLVAMPFSIMLLLFLVFRKRALERSDVLRLKSKHAGKLASKYFSEAAMHLKKNQINEFYEALSKGIYRYLSDKFSIPVSELNTDNIQHIMNEHAISEEHIKETLNRIADCEMARFAPLPQQGNSILLEQVRQLVQAIEKNKLKK